MTDPILPREEPAIQFMIVDFLSEILKFSESPTEMGRYLARQLREFMGVRAVVMVQSGTDPAGSPRIVAIEPQRAQTRTLVEGLAEISALLPDSRHAFFVLKSSAPAAIAKAMEGLGLSSMSVTPLQVGDLRAGTLFALDHLEVRHTTDLVRLLDALSPVFALILRNTLVFESQELKVLAQAENYQALLRTNLDGFVMVDGRGALLDANEAYLRMVGYSLEELRGLNVADIEAIETPSQTRQHINRMRESGSDRFHSRHRRKDGSSFPVEVSTTHVPNQNLIIGFIRDLTEREAAEHALRASEAHHRELLEMLGEGISIVDPSETFIMANPEMERILGVGPNQLVGMNLRHFLEDEEWDLVRSFTGRRSQGNSDSYEVRVKRLDGVHRILQITVTPRFDEEGTFTGSLAVARDLTESIKTAEALRLAQKMESLGSLAGGVAHDMNNVLGAIMALASVHSLEAEEGSLLHQHMETIIKACQRGGTLVKGLLGFARQGLAEKKNLDLNALVQEQVTLLERTTLQKVRLVADLAPDLDPILGDPAALSHALMNLCVNSVDAMPMGGTLTLRTRNGEAGTVQLEVADTGVGMPPEVLRKAMDPFFTTKPQGKGTGLGLSMAYSTVQAHRGRIELQSQVGQGTKILLSFPASRPAGEESGSRSRGLAVRSTKALSVLLVDDDELIQNAVQSMIEALGHRVATVSGGEEALAAVDAGLRPDVVILDMNMPGLDGAGTLPRLRERLPRVPVFLATGRIDQTAMELVDRYPCTFLFAKPFGLHELERRLGETGLAG